MTHQQALTPSIVLSSRAYPKRSLKIQPPIPWSRLLPFLLVLPGPIPVGGYLETSLANPRRIYQSPFPRVAPLTNKSILPSLGYGNAILLIGSLAYRLVNLYK